MTKIVSPDEFNDVFHDVADRKKPEISALWSDSPKYTELWLSESGGLLSEISAGLDLQYQREYWGIDAVMCEKLDSKNFDGWWAEQLAVTVEHENQISGAHQEVNRLSIYNSPLKVLITYPWVKTTPKYLAQYADILRRADVFNDFTSHRRHLVIFGYGPEDDVSWESYVYRFGEFVPIGAAP